MKFNDHCVVNSKTIYLIEKGIFIQSFLLADFIWFPISFCLAFKADDGKINQLIQSS